MEHGMAQVRHLVEQPDREVGDDDRDVDDREAASSQPIGERKHTPSLSPASAVQGSNRRPRAGLGGLSAWPTPPHPPPRRPRRVPNPPPRGERGGAGGGPPPADTRAAPPSHAVRWPVAIAK